MYMSFWNKSWRKNARVWERFVKFLTGKRLKSIMYSSVLMSGEKMVVSKHFFNCSPLRTGTITNTGVVLLSYGREDSRITSLIWRKFWIDMAKTMNSFPLTQQFRWFPYTIAFEKNFQTKIWCTSKEPVRSGAQVWSLNTLGMKVPLRDGRSTSLSTIMIAFL